MKTRNTLISVVIAATFAAGASAAYLSDSIYGAPRPGASTDTAMHADEGVPHNLVTAMKADEGVPQNLVTAMKSDEGVPQNLVTAMKSDEGVSQSS